MFFNLLSLFVQPTAWDRDPVPEDVPAPSARQKQMFQQYAEDMKQSYREFAGKPSKVSEVHHLQCSKCIKKCIMVKLEAVYKQ